MTNLNFVDASVSQDPRQLSLEKLFINNCNSSLPAIHGPNPVNSAIKTEILNSN